MIPVGSRELLRQSGRDRVRFLDHLHCFPIGLVVRVGHLREDRPDHAAGRAAAPEHGEDDAATPLLHELDEVHPSLQVHPVVPAPPAPEIHDITVVELAGRDVPIIDEPGLDPLFLQRGRNDFPGN